MTALRRDPHLWIHLAGLASVPLWLDLCLAGLAVGDPVVPPWLEMGLLGLIGSGPLLWMQWQRPFYPFSLLLFAIRPDSLSPQRLQLLSQQRSWLGKTLAVVSASILVGALVLLYPLAPIAAGCTPFAGQSRAVGWLIGAIALFLANFFLQLAMSALQLLLTPDRVLGHTATYDTPRILQDFTVWGIRLRQVLPELQDDRDAIPDGPTAQAAADDANVMPGLVMVQAPIEHHAKPSPLTPLAESQLSEESSVDLSSGNPLEISDLPTAVAEEDLSDPVEEVAKRSDVGLLTHENNLETTATHPEQEAHDVHLAPAPLATAAETLADERLEEQLPGATPSEYTESSPLEEAETLHASVSNNTNSHY
ncbi:MAG: low-complexity tail membrane protein [Cyanobacteria bacterium P01_H01_bin.58]